MSGHTREIRSGVNHECIREKVGIVPSDLYIVELCLSWFDRILNEKKTNISSNERVWGRPRKTLS